MMVVLDMATNDDVREYLSKLGRKGAKAANRARTPEQRKEVARRAAQARWAKAKKNKED
jgi:hypothetical protein